MKKPLLIVVIVLVVILALPVFSFIRWAFQEKKPLDVIILDKTVLNLDRINHKSFTWILTNERFVKKSGGSYNYRKDYYGFYPTRPLRERQWRTVNLRLPDIMDVVENNDALYFTDTYGVYMSEWYRSFTRSRRPRKLYGGLNNTDYLYIMEMKNREKLCILEYNTFDYPTPDLERYKVKELLGIEFRGWTGKYFHSLDTLAKGNEDFPAWMTAMYRKQYRKPWSFSKPGIVFLKGSTILVLEEGTHLKNAMPLIMTDSSYCSKYDVAEKVGFGGWFDVIDSKQNKVISNYNLETTAVGDTLLFENMLTASFPAVITDTLKQRTYYFCGDFAANKVDAWTARFIGFEKLKIINYSDKETDARRFFWLYYRPLINGIFRDYYEAVKTK
jgi:hypothetical protein